MFNVERRLYACPRDEEKSFETREEALRWIATCPPGEYDLELEGIEIGLAVDYLVNVSEPGSPLQRIELPANRDAAEVFDAYLGAQEVES